MLLSLFEAMLARAGFTLLKASAQPNGGERRIYRRRSGDPLVNVPVERGEVDDFDALKIEVLLHEEGFFQDDQA